MGVLELFATRMEFGLASYDDAAESSSGAETLKIETQQVTNPQAMLEKGNASCTYGGLERAELAMSVARLVDWARQDAGRVAILNDCPDNAKSNVRAKKYTASLLPANCLFDVNSCCAVHKSHGFLTKAIGEEKVVGHVHAVQFVLNLRHHRVVLHGALRHLVERELHIIPGDPLAEDSALMDAMVEQTLQRSVRLVRARVQEDGSALCEERRGKTIAAAIPALKAMVNTNIMVPRLGHRCMGCCTNAVGETSREVQVENVCASILGAGLLGGVNHAVPAKSRWQSMAFTLAMVAFGMVCHAILPRCWRLAFGEFEIPRPIDVNGRADDFHMMVRSKIRRSGFWLNHDDTTWSSLVLLLCSVPLDHLMRGVQHLDEKGNALANLLEPATNPFLKCTRSLATMILDEDSPPLRILPKMFGDASGGST